MAETLPLDPVPFTEPVVVEEGAPAPEENADGAQTENGCTVLVCWLLGNTYDETAFMEAVFLSEVLMGHDASPLFKALLDSGLGEDIAPSSGLESELKRLMLQAGLRGVQRGDAVKVEQCILDTLRQLVQKSIPEHDIQAACMSVDFSIREVKRAHGPYSLMLMRRVLRSWIYGGNPWECLFVRDAFEEIKRRIAADPNYVRSLIEELLNNLHRSLVTVYPDPAYNERRKKAEAERAQKNLSTSSGKEVRRAQKELIRFQNSKEDETNAACMPHLKPSDLNVRVDAITSTLETGAHGVPVIKSVERTNGIVYVVAAFPLDALDIADYPLLPFFSTALTNTGFGGKSWAECASEIALTVGGLNASLVTSSSAPGTGEVEQALIGRNWLFVQVKMLAEKTDASLALLSRCLTGAEFADAKRLGDLVLEARNDIRSSIIPSGHEYAMLRACRFFSASRALDEVWNGVSQLFTMQNLAAPPTGDASSALPISAEALSERLRGIRALLLASGAVLHVTADTFPRWISRLNALLKAAAYARQNLKKSRTVRAYSVSRNLHSSAAMLNYAPCRLKWDMPPSRLRHRPTERPKAHMKRCSRIGFQTHFSGSKSERSAAHTARLPSPTALSACLPWKHTATQNLTHRSMFFCPASKTRLRRRSTRQPLNARYAAHTAKKCSPKRRRGGVIPDSCVSSTALPNRCAKTESPAFWL
jgi:Zn-dependent M16 (insulinase) family peptidase